MENLLYDDKLKVNVPDDFTGINWSDYSKYFGDNPVDYGFIDEKTGAILTFIVRQDSTLESDDVAKKMSLIKTGYANSKLPGYHESECLFKQLKDHNLGFLTFTIAGEEKTDYYLLGLTNFDGKELIINFTVNLIHMPNMLSKIVKMCEEMEFNGK